MLLPTLKPRLFWTPLALWFLAVAASSALPVRAHEQVIYTVTDLGTLGGPTSTGINALGQVTGFSDRSSISGDQHAFRTSPGGRISDLGADLGTLGGTFSRGFGINALGQVTGFSLTSGPASHAFRTTPTGGLGDPSADLGAFASLPSGNSSGFGINASEGV
jgi:probable HAF family extracellular repeat protein